MKLIRIATRGSELALVQANYVAGRIESELGVKTEVVVVTTTGDRIQDVSLAKIGGKGLFIKEVEEALLRGEADVAVHSAKDLPAEIEAGLELVAFPERADCRDALVSRRQGQGLAELPEGARVGTGSTRRAAMLRAHRPDLEIVALRGNVPTRLAKLEQDDLAAIILACAGLDRLDRAGVISERISPDILLPAVCQGVLALEARTDDPLTQNLRTLNEARTARAATAERVFLSRLGGDCTVPLAAHCDFISESKIRIRGLLARSDGSGMARGEVAGAADAAEALGRELAERVLERGGEEILEALRREAVEDEES